MGKLGHIGAVSGNARLLAWVDEITRLCRPDLVHWCSGSEAEALALIAKMLDAGTLLQLDPGKRPNSFLARSDLLLDRGAHRFQIEPHLQQHAHG